MWHGFSADARRLAADNPLITTTRLCAAAMKPWRPETDALPLRPKLARREWTRLHNYWRAPTERPKLPDGAKAGLVLLAAACIGAAIGLYEVAGPRDVFERDSAIDWNAVDEVATH